MDKMDLNLRVENHSGDINNVLQINKEQLAGLSNNPEFSILVDGLEGLVKQLGYQFDLNVNMLGNKDIYLVLNALASALITDPADLHNFVWNQEGYNIGRLLTLLNGADINIVIERMHAYITDRNVLGADQAWDPAFAVENKKHIARILWHVRNTIRTYDENEYAVTVGTGLETEVIEKSEEIQEFVNRLISQFEVYNFSNVSPDTFRAQGNEYGIEGILEKINYMSETGMARLEEVLPGDENKVRRLQILEGVLNHFAERFNTKLEDLFIELVNEGNFIVDLGIQGVGKGTIADSNNILKELLNVELSADGEFEIKDKTVSGINEFRAAFKNLPDQVQYILNTQFKLAGSEDYKVERATGTGAMYNPSPVNPNKPSIYDVYFGKVKFAGQFVGAGLMLGDALTHMMVMIENCLAALEARAKDIKKLTIQWDVYPRTDGQVKLMKSLVARMGESGNLDMSNFFGFKKETLKKHQESPLESKSAALAWGVAEGRMKVKNSLINDALLKSGVYGNIYDLLENELKDDQFADIISGLISQADPKAKHKYLEEKAKGNASFWRKVEELILKNNQTLENLFIDGTFNTIMQAELQAELTKPKYASVKPGFIGNIAEIKEFIDDYVRQTTRSLDLIAGRISQKLRFDDTDFFNTMGRMASNDRDSLPGLFDELDHFAVGYEGGEAYSQYVEQTLTKKASGFDIEDPNWLKFRAMLAKLHANINLGKNKEVSFEAQEA